MTERSASEDRSHTGEWKTSVYITAGDAVADANKKLQPGTIVTVVFKAQDNSPVLMYYFE
jgi:adenosylcobinamide amidohydrolase